MNGVRARALTSLLVGVALAVGAAPPARAAQAPPSVTRLTPASGPVQGGTSVVLKGRGLTDVKKVLFGSTKATRVRARSAKKLVVTAPPHAAGVVQVKVVTRHGSSRQTSAAAFTYLAPPPALTSLTPRAGPVAGGTQVTLTGTELAGASTVRFGSTPATFHVVSPTTVVATAPAHSTGTVGVTVVTVGGSSLLDGAFTYVPPPTLSSVGPASGPMAGSTVTMVGTGLTGAQVTFDGMVAADVQIAPDGTSLTATTPAHAAGWAEVRVTTIGGAAVLTHGYLYVGGTALTGVAPSVGPADGGATVTLTGSGFTDDTLVLFGNKPSLEVTANPSGTVLTALLPAHAAGLVDVQVSTVGDSTVLADAFTYVDAPTLTSLAPQTGPTGGGDTVTLTGSGFRAGMSVAFGGTAATNVTVDSGTQATVTTPAHAAGGVDVTVTTPGGSDTLVGGYTYVAAPTVTAVAPAAGPTDGGTSVTLSGSGFRSGMQVDFGGTTATVMSVSPGGAQATVTTPAHAAGAVDVTVTTPGGSDTLAGGYTYVDAPILSGVTPSAGPTDGGDTVTLTGSGFTDDTLVLFGDIPATGVAVNPAGTQLTASTPAHAAGTVDVTVSTPGGSATLTDGYTYVAPPSLTVVAPDSGPVAGGTTVTLTGSGFLAGAEVRFGGAAATDVSVSSDTELTLVTPAHSAGTVDVTVTTPGGTVTLGSSFTYVDPPILIAAAPDIGPAGGGTPVVLTGAGLLRTTAVTFDGVPADSFSVDSDGQVTAVAPAHPDGPVDVVVTTPGGTATLVGGFTYLL